MTTTPVPHRRPHPVRCGRSHCTRPSGCSGIGFTAAPILFGLDKFTNLLTDWDPSRPPFIDRLVPGTAHQAMLAVGVIEIIAGLLVAVLPRIGVYVVAAWLGGIIVNLLLLGDFGNYIALRDFGLLLGALALARLATAVQAHDDRPGAGESTTAAAEPSSGKAVPKKRAWMNESPIRRVRQRDSTERGGGMSDHTRTTTATSRRAADHGRTVPIRVMAAAGVVAALVLGWAFRAELGFADQAADAAGPTAPHTGHDVPGKTAFTTDGTVSPKQAASSGPVSELDKQLLIKVRQANLWELPAGRLAQSNHLE